ncbi:hypothetical protein A3762_02710 [Oleiphilus sp. HI0125]|uniref:alpha/beta fold hydrolase n=3 Tax=Oleiphilus sp. HI0125 TaxID=1822266 RepID=UPI0007C2D623|nr:alpha/beta hydrolase [Oleiphilus sp. HI0125]KZZ60807.1 hypothetical protein A3762_02710 [Oleiphilus sp. HI0125]
MNDAQKALAQWREQGRFFEFEGHQVFYQDSQDANKPVLVMLHGFPTSSWDWQEIWPRLTQYFRVITFDFLGFGFSDKPNLPKYSIMMQASIAEALVNACGVADYHLLAHDYGNTVAQELLARNQENPDAKKLSCVFLNGGLFPEVHRPLLTQKLLRSPFGKFFARMASLRSFVSSFNTICAVKLPRDLLQEHFNLLARENGRHCMVKLVGYMDERALHRERWVGSVVNSAIPLRFINGVEDPISGLHMAARFEELVPNPDVIKLSGIGHYPQNEAPEDVLRAAISFWQSNNVIE